MWNNPVEQLLWNDPFEQYVRSLTDENFQRMKEITARRIGWSVEDLNAFYELLEEQVNKRIEETLANCAPVRDLGLGNALEETFSCASSIRENLSNKAKNSH